ncbi:TetR/AcrR family transcriptional regulator C-terminal domain-containing protein [Brevibacterium album]|uniref:TetR/AcrR family transcriptional regulator C-terminal domain-containing protein n=1 Tax=Brevibacterium album TaxID=417948 RepID=UPI00040721A0|nr:TetR/AcrR family transcriptional regulator C-terminal domain-containing protein [Brevibacterium album]
MSYWEHRRPVRRKRALDPADIAAASAALLDAGGLPALTVRAVARELGVAAASLYSRIDSADDLADLALDHALGQDTEVHRTLASDEGTAAGEPLPDSPGSGETAAGTSSAHSHAELHRLLLAYFRHLRRHPWACQVIAARPPRGPEYLRLSERMIVLLARSGTADPLGTAYALSNFVIGSATTAGMAPAEMSSAVDPDIAPAYARLHTGRGAGPGRGDGSGDDGTGGGSDPAPAADPETIASAGLTALLAGLTAAG